MSYGLKYTIPFKTISEVSCVINIEVKDFVGTPTELIAGATPIRIDTDTEDVLTPIRSSGATIQVFGSDYLQDIYTSDPQGIKVKLYENSAVKWIGYLTPDTFSQDYSRPEFTYEMEAVSAFSTLKYKEFDLTDDFVTFRQILDKAVEYSGYEVIYLTNSVKAELTDYFNLKIATANFYDELGEAMSYYEVLEEIAKFAGCCWVPYEEDLYFLDYQAIRSGYNSYTRIVGNSVSNVTLQDLKGVENYKGTGTKLSRIAGKNKAVVNCSLYEVSNIIPDFDEKGTTLVNTISPEDTVKEGKEDVTYKAIIRKYKQPRFAFYHYISGNPANRVESNMPVTGANTGSSFARTTEFRKDEPPARLSMVNELQVKTCNSYDAAMAGNYLAQNSPILTLRSEREVLTHKDVWFAINLQTKWSLSEWHKSLGGIRIRYSSDGHEVMKARVKLGNLYYNGTGWSTAESTFSIMIPHKKGEDLINLYRPVENQNSYELGIGDLEGYLFKAPSYPVIGHMELTLYSMPYTYFSPVLKDITQYLYLKDISLDCAIPDESSIYGDWVDKDTKNDLLYENVIDGGYVEEADEIDLKICTNTDGKLAFSSILEGNNFLSKIRTDVFGAGVAEEILLQRVVSLYSKPRFNINPILENTAKPYTKFTEPHLNKQFLVAGGEEDVKMETTQYNLIEA